MGQFSNERNRSPTSATYRPSMYERLGPDASMYLRALPYVVVVFACTLMLFSVLRQKLEYSSGLVLPLAIVVTAAVTWAGMRIAGGIGVAAGRIVVPTGNSTPYEHQFSREDALAARGDTAGALESFEAAIATTPLESPLGVSARVRAAELYMTPGGNPERAAALFREVQRADGVTPAQDIYVSNRLIDLLLGPLDQPRRALVELRRIADRYPNSNAAMHARTAIVAIKHRLG
jgi:hypothetical protein